MAKTSLLNFYVEPSVETQVRRLSQVLGQPVSEVLRIAVDRMLLSPEAQVLLSFSDREERLLFEVEQHRLGVKRDTASDLRSFS